jgi:hypothetical protein
MINRRPNRFRSHLAVVVAATLCGASLAATAAPASAAAGGALVYGLTTDNRIVTFRAQTPGTASAGVSVAGLQAAEDLLAIDVRPATGQLYALGSTSRLYVVNPTTGAATQVGSGPFTPALSGTSFGFAFNPMVDRIRVVSDADQNFRLNPSTGATAGTDTALQYAGGDPNFGGNPGVVAAGYTNSFSGATSTTLYDIDVTDDALVTQNPPNNGTLNTVGSLGVDAQSPSGLDIDGATGTAYAVLTTAGAPAFWTINLATGAATLVGSTESTVEDIAVATPLISVDATTVAEGASAGVTVRRTGDTADAATVDFSTSPGSATAGADYTAVNGTVSFAAGQSTQTFGVPTLQDALTEGSETLNVVLSNPSAGSVLTSATALVTIQDDEPGSAYGLTAGNAIVAFSVNTPGTTGTPVPVTGLQPGEDLVGIDVRPATGQLVAVGSTSRVYDINPSTGTATLMVVMSSPLNGTSFGIDVNPTVDRLRIVSDTGQNLRVNLSTGDVFVDNALAYDAADPGNGTPPNVTGIAYTNNVAGATSTTLYDVEAVRDVLAIQVPPNNGTLTTVGNLTTPTSDVEPVGLDISSQGGAMFAVTTLNFGGDPRLFRIDTSTGQTYDLGALGNVTIEDLALASVAPVPPPPGPPPPSDPTPSPSASPSASPSPTPSASPSASPSSGSRAVLSLTPLDPLIPAGTTARLTGSGAANEAYELRCYTRPSTTYVTARSGTFNASGDPVTFTLSLGRNTRCFLQYATDSAQGASGSVVVNVRTVLSLSAVRTGVRTYVFQGRNLPRVAGQLITLYRIDGAGHEIRTANLTSDASGVYRLTRTFTGVGTFRFLVRTSQTLSNAPGSSNVITVAIH